jgi:hypothetical protein
MPDKPLNMPIRAAPYRHQREAYAFALQKMDAGGGAALLMEMGTGKTLTAIAIAGALLRGRAFSGCSSSRPSPSWGWEDEFAKFAAFDYALTVLGARLRRRPRPSGT